MKELANVIIYLIGLPGTGKYTIAKELTKLANFKLVDNHLINNPIFTVIDVEGKTTKIPEEIWVKVREIKNIVFDTILKFSSASANFIFTNHLLESEDQSAHDTYNKIADLAEKRKSLFMPVRLICNAEQLTKRISSPERASRLKMTCPVEAKRFVEEEVVYKTNNPNCLTLDVSDKTAEDAAQEILTYIPYA
jgi:hypothetical protein